MLTHEKLKELLTYNKENGEWTWNEKDSGRRLNRVAGSVCWISAGKYKKLQRKVIFIEGKSYYAARLAWLYMTGEWPKNEIDHIDRDSLNDKWENLRDVTRSQSSSNRNPWRWRSTQRYP